MEFSIIIFLIILTYACDSRLPFFILGICYLFIFVFILLRWKDTIGRKVMCMFLLGMTDSSLLFHYSCKLLEKNFDFEDNLKRTKYMKERTFFSFQSG